MTTHQADPRRRPGAGGYPLARPIMAQPVTASPVTRLWHGLLAAAILMASALPTYAQSQTPAQPPAAAPNTTPAEAKPEVERIGDWALQCTQAQTDKPRVCFLIHDVFRTEGSQRILQIVVGRFGTDNVLAALFFVPLGIRLPPGLTLQVDQNAPQLMPLERCTTKGCQAQILLDDALMAAFKAGNGGEITFDDAAGRSIVVAFSLKGFTAGIKKLP